MNALDIALLFTALKGGHLQEMQREGDTLRFQVLHAALAGKRNADFTLFYCALSGCTGFELQPFRNESTILSDLGQMARLKLHLKGATPQESHVDVHCSGDGCSEARLIVRAAALSVWDEAFDPLGAEDLARLRKAGRTAPAD